MSNFNHFDNEVDPLDMDFEDLLNPGATDDTNTFHPTTAVQQPLHQTTSYGPSASRVGLSGYGNTYVHHQIMGMLYTPDIFQQHQYFPPQQSPPQHQYFPIQQLPPQPQNVYAVAPAPTISRQNARQPVQPTQPANFAEAAVQYDQLGLPMQSFERPQHFSPPTGHYAQAQPASASGGKHPSDYPRRGQNESTSKRAPKKLSPPGKPAAVRTDRDLTPTTKADYDSLLFRDPEVISSWRNPPFHYTNQEITHILQFFEQVCQIKSQARVDQILRQRQPDIIGQDQWDRLDDLDPLKLFKPSETGLNRGVPWVGYVLNASIEGDRPVIDDSQPTRKKRGDGGHQLSGHPKHWECVPVGKSCLEMLREYPNHLAYEFLDAFLQHQVSAGDIWRALPPQTQKEIREQILSSEDGDNFAKKRLDKRMLVLLAKSGGDYAKLDAYLRSPIKLRELGLVQTRLDDKTSDVWLLKSKNEAKKAKRESWERNQANGKVGSDHHLLSDPTISSTTTEAMPPTSISPPVQQQARTNGAASTRESVRPNGQTSIPPPIKDLSPGIPPEASYAPPFPTGNQVSASNHLPVHITFSAAVTSTSLGHIGGTQFWRSRKEFTKHVQEIFSLNAQSRKLLCWISEHDEKGPSFDQAQKAKLRNDAMAYLFYEQCRQKDPTSELEMGESGKTDVKTVVAQLEAEIAAHIRKIGGVQNLDRAAVETVKHELLDQQINLYKSTTQAFATLVGKVLRGDRKGVFDAATELSALKDAENLASAADMAIEAQCVGESTLKQRFFYSDHLKTSMAHDIIQAVQRNDNAIRNDLAFLLAMKKETLATKQTMVSDHPTIQLSAVLKGTAECLFDEILEQIDEELKTFRDKSTRDTPAPKKHGRDDDDNDDEDDDPRYPPRKKARNTPSDSLTKRKDSQANHPSQRGGSRLSQNQCDDQHQTPSAKPSERRKDSAAAATANAPASSLQEREAQDKPEVSRLPSAPQSELASFAAESVFQQTAMQSIVDSRSQHASLKTVNVGKGFAEYANRAIGGVRTLPQALLQHKARVSGAAGVPGQSQRPNPRKRQREEDGESHPQERTKKSSRQETKVEWIAPYPVEVHFAFFDMQHGFEDVPEIGFSALDGLCGLELEVVHSVYFGDETVSDEDCELPEYLSLASWSSKNLAV